MNIRHILKHRPDNPVDDKAIEDMGIRQISRYHPDDFIDGSRIEEAISKHREIAAKVIRRIWQWKEKAILDFMLETGLLHYILSGNPDFVSIAKRAEKTGKLDQQYVIRLRKIANESTYLLSGMIPILIREYYGGKALDSWQMPLVTFGAILFLDDQAMIDAVAEDILALTDEGVEKFAGKYLNVLNNALNILTLARHDAMLDKFTLGWKTLLEHFQNQETAIESFDDAEKFYRVFSKAWCVIRKEAYDYFRTIRANLINVLSGENNGIFAEALKCDLWNFGSWLTKDTGSMMERIFRNEIQNDFIGMAAGDLRRTLSRITPPFSEQDMKIALDEIEKLENDELDEKDSILLRVILPALRGELPDPDPETVNAECLYSFSLFSRLRKGLHSLEPGSESFAAEKRAIELLRQPEAASIEDAAPDSEQPESGNPEDNEIHVREDEGIGILPDDVEIMENFRKDCVLSAHLDFWNESLTDAELALLDNVGGLKRFLSAPREKSQGGRKNAGDDSDSKEAHTITLDDLCSATEAAIEADDMDAFHYIFSVCDCETTIVDAIWLGKHNPESPLLVSMMPRIMEATAFCANAFGDVTFLVLAAYIRPMILHPRQEYAGLLNGHMSFASRYGLTWLFGELLKICVAEKRPENFVQLRKAFKKIHRKGLSSLNGRLFSKRINDTLNGVDYPRREIYALEVWTCGVNGIGDMVARRWRKPEVVAKNIIGKLEAGRVGLVAAYLEDHPEYGSFKDRDGRTIREKLNEWIGLNKSIYRAAVRACGALFIEDAELARVIAEKVNFYRSEASVLLSGIRLPEKAKLERLHLPCLFQDWLASEQEEATFAHRNEGDIKAILSRFGFEDTRIEKTGEAPETAHAWTFCGIKAKGATGNPPPFDNETRLVAAIGDGSYETLEEMDSFEYLAGTFSGPEPLIIILDGSLNARERLEVLGLDWKMPVMIVDRLFYRYFCLDNHENDVWLGSFMKTENYNPCMYANGAESWLQRLGISENGDTFRAFMKMDDNERHYAFNYLIKNAPENPEEAIFAGMNPPDEKFQEICGIFAKNRGVMEDSDIGKSSNPARTRQLLDVLCKGGIAAYLDGKYMQLERMPYLEAKQETTESSIGGK